MTNVEQIARIAHETNRVYCESIGDTSQPSWENAPEWQRTSAIKGVQFHLDAHSRGEVPPASASHESWLEEKRADGWIYGPVKDPVLKEHPCYVPYIQLPLNQRLKDYLFGHIVAAFVQAMNEVKDTACFFHCFS